MKRDEIIIDPIIISEYLHREKTGWDTERSKFFVSIVNSIKARHPQYKLTELVKYYINYNKAPQNEDTKHYWYERIYNNPNRHSKKVYADKLQLIEFLLFFDVYDDIDFILKKLGHDDLYIFKMEECAAKISIKIKKKYPDKPPYILYRELLTDQVIQSIRSDDNIIDYNQPLLLTSYAMPDFDKIDSIESARDFIEQYKNQFGRVRITRYFMFQALYSDCLFDINTIKSGSIENFRLNDIPYSIYNILTATLYNVQFLKQLNFKMAESVVINYISAQINKKLLDLNDNETIFDFVLRKNYEQDDIMYIYCLAYAHVITGHYDFDIRDLSDGFKKRYSDECIKCLKGKIVHGKGKNIQKSLLKGILEDKDMIENKNQTPLLTSNIDIAKAINYNQSVSRDIILLSVVFSLSADTLEKQYIDDFNNIDKELLIAHIARDIDGVLSLCGFCAMNSDISKLDYLLTHSITWYADSFDKIYRKKSKEDYYPFREFVITFLKQVQLQTQTEEVSH